MAGEGRQDQSWQGNQRGKVKTLEPRHDFREPGRQQAFAVFFEAVGLHDVFDGAALLGNFQFAVAVGAFEGDMQVGEQRVSLQGR